MSQERGNHRADHRHVQRRSRPGTGPSVGRLATPKGLAYNTRPPRVQPITSTAAGAKAVSAQRFGPDDTWPSHQKSPHWNKPLGEARRAGWTLTFINAPHRFGVVSCPSGEHTFDVDQTATGGETKSKEATKKIRWCRHGTGQGGSKVRARQEECTHLLEVADELIAAAAEGLTMAEVKQAAEEELDRLELQLQTANSNVDEVDAALQAAMDADDAPEPEAVSALLDDADATVARGEAVAKALRVGRPNLATPLLERAQGARMRIGQLSSRLTVLQERIRPDSG